MAAVIEFTRTSVRLIVAEGDGKLRVRQALIEPLASVQETGPRLARLVKQAKLEAHAEVIMTIPREQVITRLLKFPTIRPDELARMVDLTGKAQLPFPREQAVADYQVLEQGNGSTTVQLVACHRHVVDQAAAMARQAGCEPQAIVPSSWGVLAWYQHLGRTPDVPEPALVLNVDADHTDLVIVQQGRLMFSRSLTQGLADWQASADPVAALAQELDRSLSGLRKELAGVEVAGIMLTGVGPLAEWRTALAPQLGKSVGVRPLQARELAQWGGASPVVCAGLAVAEPRGMLNLLPPEARMAQRTRRQTRQLAVTGVLGAVAVIVGVLALFVWGQRQETQTQTLLTRVAELERMAKQTQRQQEEIDRIQSTLTSRRRLAELMEELFRITPATVMLENFGFERSRRELIVRGNAPTTRDVLDYIRQLEETGHYERVELRYSARRNRPGGSRAEFELMAKLPAA